MIHIEADHLSQECRILLDVCYDVDLVENYARVEDVECGVIKCAGEDNVFEELKAVSVVYFALDDWVPDDDGLMEVGVLVKKLAIIGFVVGEFGVIYRRLRLSGDMA